MVTSECYVLFVKVVIGISLALTEPEAISNCIESKFDVKGVWVKAIYAIKVLAKQVLAHEKVELFPA